MKPLITHPWSLSQAEAKQLQEHLASKVIVTEQLLSVQLVAGIDLAYQKNGDQVFAAIVVLDANTLEVVETTSSQGKSCFPYIPGLLSFREIPFIVDALSQLQSQPDLFVCDGQGLAHPRRFGLACHLGVLYDKPTIGCAKSRFIGKYEEPGFKRGDYSELKEQEEVIGRVLRTQDSLKPLFISCGHKISLANSCKWILKLTPKYRQPETTRQADQLATKLRKQFMEQ